MNSFRSPFPIILPLLAGLAALAAAALGCAAPLDESPRPDHGATVAALLPTAELTPPAAPTPAAPMPSPVPAAAAPAVATAPTATATPLPTYTPRPLPAQPVADAREPAVLFQARLLDGAELSLAETYGTPTLLAFWAPW